MSGTRPQPNSEATRDHEAERTASGSAGKEHEQPESENKQQEIVHGKNAPDNQDDDIECI
jgi:hypothetical protein